MTVDHQKNLLIDGLTESDFMAVYHDGELAAIEGRSLLDCPFLDQPRFLSVWMQGYMDLPIDAFGSAAPAAPAVS